MSTANIWWRICWRSSGAAMPTVAMVKNWGDALLLQAATNGTIVRVNLDLEE